MTRAHLAISAFIKVVSSSGVLLIGSTATYWLKQSGGWDQARWAYLFDEGLISGKEADSWANEVWGDPEELSPEEEEFLQAAKNPKPVDQGKQNG